MRHEGVIAVPIEGSKERYIACKYWVEADDMGSKYGINGGRIRKLTVRVDGAVTAGYDRGWNVPPEDDAAQKAVAILLHDYN